MLLQTSFAISTDRLVHESRLTPVEISKNKRPSVSDRLKYNIKDDFRKAVEDSGLSGLQNDEGSKDKKFHKMLISYIDQKNFKKNAVIQILNKITGSVSEFSLRINKKFIYDDLYFSVSKCWQAPLDQMPESKILIKVSIVEDENKKAEKSIFYGWIFSSSPSVSGLEHPIYDITAINCHN